MAYDPNWPQNGQLVDGDRFREQFGGLHDLIPTEGVVSSAQVDSVTPLPPGSAPTAAAALVGGSVRFDFGIPVSVSSIVFDSVATVPATDPATASAALIGEALHVSLSIPRGFDGAAGAPGEVSNGSLNAAISAAIAGTSGNSNGVGTLDTPFADADDEALRGKVNELILALRRS